MREIKKQFPEEIRDIFEGLWQEVAHLHELWQLYLDIYVDEKNLEIINETVPAVFILVEESLRTSMTASIGRLLDPLKTSGKENLSLSTLLNALENLKGCPVGLLATANKLFTEIEDQCAPLKHLRNKKVAHNDLATKLKPTDNPLPGMGRKSIESILEKIAELLNRIDITYRDHQTAFDHGIQNGTGKDLIFLLGEALEYDQLRQKNRW